MKFLMELSPHTMNPAPAFEQPGSRPASARSVSSTGVQVQTSHRMIAPRTPLGYAGILPIRSPAGGQERPGQDGDT